jgi:regulator of RNase E activity RraA
VSKRLWTAISPLLILFAAAESRAQLNSLTREDLIKYTSKNPYERFPDGRPKVPDSVLAKLKDMSSEEFMMAAVRSGGNVFADGFQLLHPGKKLIGRAFTLQMMPTRSDIAEVDQAEWKAKGNTRRLGNQSAIDLLQPGDVLVVDLYGSVAAGGVIGNNLAYYIWKKTGTGFVVDGAIRDLDGISECDMAGYFRGTTTDWVRNSMVTGINVPVRIGNVTVMPGDVVFGDREGVSFIPPHLIEDLANTARITHIHDDWTKLKFDQGKYKSSDIYSRPTDPELIKEYEEYLKEKLGPKEYEEYRKRMSQRPPGAPGTKPVR